MWLKKTKSNIYKDILFGLSIGDALGVPVEFKKREDISLKPVTDMRSYGTYSLPSGTFSDDSSLAFCLAEALTHDFSLQQVADNFIAWLHNNFWTALGDVFDVGITTKYAIERLDKGYQPESAGGSGINENGNGSLMRILPLITYTLNKPVDERFQITKQVSSITHRHIRSVIACFYYLEFALQLINEKEKVEIYKNLQSEIPSVLHSFSVDPAEIEIFNRLLQNDIYLLTEKNIKSSGYVLDTLEASTWCIMTTNNYKEAVLKAVNLGSDSDTTGAVTGGLAGLLYGWENIPESWLNQLARKRDIEDLAERMQTALEKHSVI